MCGCVYIYISMHRMYDLAQIATYNMYIYIYVYNDNIYMYNITYTYTHIQYTYALFFFVNWFSSI